MLARRTYNYELTALSSMAIDVAETHYLRMKPAMNAKRAARNKQSLQT